MAATASSYTTCVLVLWDHPFPTESNQAHDHLVSC